MRNLIVSLILTLFGTTAFAAEDEPLIVVEFYTSEGCSSCPPAEKIFAELAARDNVLALALHVDYWDYLGWTDRFSMAKFADRQEYYNMVMGNRYRLVTPQMFFHGQSSVAGAKPKKINAHLERLKNQADKVVLNVENLAGAYRVSVNPVGPAVASADVFLVQYKASQTTQVMAGENKGLTLKHTNIVTSWDRMGEWSGQGSWIVKNNTVADGNHLAVIVQTPHNGPILAARKLN